MVFDIITGNDIDTPFFCEELQDTFDVGILNIKIYQSGGISGLHRKGSVFAGVPDGFGQFFGLHIGGGHGFHRRLRGGGLHGQRCHIKINDDVMTILSDTIRDQLVQFDPDDGLLIVVIYLLNRYDPDEIIESPLTHGSPQCLWNEEIIHFDQNNIARLIFSESPRLS